MNTRISSRLMNLIPKSMQKRYELMQFRKSNPKTILITPVYSDLNDGYSQARQDKIVFDAFFNHKTDGVFLDIGANDPRKYNNTLLFEESGWKGIAMDPLPEMEDKWNMSGRTARYIRCAASNVRERVIFEVMKGEEERASMFSSVKGYKPRWQTNYEIQEIEVEAFPLREILKTEKIDHVDYASIDVEGYEMKVLEGIDFDATQFMVLSIENNAGKYKRFGDPLIHSFMKSKGFELYARILDLDDIFVNERLIT